MINRRKKLHLLRNLNTTVIKSLSDLEAKRIIEESLAIVQISKMDQHKIEYLTYTNSLSETVTYLIIRVKNKHIKKITV